MANKRQTPVSLLIEALQEEMASSPKEVWQGMEYAIAIAKTFLDEEQKIMCKFADDWHRVQRQLDEEMDETDSSLGRF
tara:strand:- start:760 stop:993 length:234 start_codon:yes stop_codon:yes gene_type:complete